MSYLNTPWFQMDKQEQRGRHDFSKFTQPFSRVLLAIGSGTYRQDLPCPSTHVILRLGDRNSHIRTTVVTSLLSTCSQKETKKGLHLCLTFSFCEQELARFSFTFHFQFPTQLQGHTYQLHHLLLIKSCPGATLYETIYRQTTRSLRSPPN